MKVSKVLVTLALIVGTAVILDAQTRLRFQAAAGGSGWTLSTTFNTASELIQITPDINNSSTRFQWAQAAGSWLNGSQDCTTFKPNGCSAAPWTGNKEQITTAANYDGPGSTGPTTRGQRHWVGHSTILPGSPYISSCSPANQAVGCNDTVGSGSLYWKFPAVTQEFWTRFYVRWQAGLELGGQQGVALSTRARNHKMWYLTGGNCGAAGGCYFDIAGTHWGYINGNSGQTKHFGTGWDGLFGPGSERPSDGRWICLETRLKNASGPGTGDNGEFELWIDGTQHGGLQTGIDMGGAVDLGPDLTFPSNHQYATVNGIYFDTSTDMYEDFDEMVVSTSGRIGCL